MLYCEPRTDQEKSIGIGWSPSGLASICGVCACFLRVWAKYRVSPTRAWRLGAKKQIEIEEAEVSPTRAWRLGRDILRVRIGGRNYQNKKERYDRG